MSDVKDGLYKENTVMRIEILRKGDKVIGFSNNVIGVQRKSGEVDLVPIVMDGGLPRVDTDNIITIGYGNNTVTAIDADNNIEITSF